MRHLVLVLLLCGPGCATVMSGASTYERVVIITRPVGAEVRTLYGDVRPCGGSTIYVRKGPASAAVEVYADGYEPKHVEIQSSTSPWLIGNFLIGGFFGLLIDLGCGCAYDMTEQVSVSLKECKEPQAHGAGALVGKTMTRGDYEAERERARARAREAERRRQEESYQYR